MSKPSTTGPGTFFEYQGARLHYQASGQGPGVLLAFHGFGQTHMHYHRLAQAVQGRYRVYSFDLFYHGKSFWPQGEQPLTKAFWQGLVAAFIQQHAISRFSVVGFSMGGKFALATLEAFAPQLEEVILIAPDGVKTSFWYSLATYPSGFRNYFRRTVEKPDSLFWIMRLFRRLRVVDRGVLRFAKNQMDTPERRKRVYYSWVVFRLLQFNMKTMASLVNQHKIRLCLYLGRYDKVITRPNMEVLLKHLEDYELNILDTGHSTLIDGVAKELNKN